MKKLREWVKLPDNLAALMALTAVAHHTDLESGIAEMTYDELCAACSLSRAKLAAGLRILHERQILTREPRGRGSYGLAGFDPSAHWAKFPCSGMYRADRIGLFGGFHLRSPVELHAVKLLFLFAARRDRFSNVARLSYDKIADYSGIGREHVRSGLDKLINHDLVRIERSPAANEHAMATSYRLALIDPYRHAATTGRAGEAKSALEMQDIPDAAW
jgi:hypothetical protein